MLDCVSLSAEETKKLERVRRGGTGGAASHQELRDKSQGMIALTGVLGSECGVSALQE